MGVQNSSASGNNKTLIMVLGAARSGTTMLDLMLGNSDDVFSCGEVWCMFRAHHFRPGCSCGDSGCAVEYPQEFLDDFSLLNDEQGPDDEISSSIKRLEAREFVASSIASEERAVSGSLLKPVWYYYHGLKAVYRKSFPASGPLAE